MSAMRRSVPLAAVSALTVLASACGTGSSAAPLPAASAPGVTATTVQFATVDASTSPWSIGSASLDAGIQAAFDWVNGRGGVNGRRLEFMSEAIPATPTAAAVAAQNLLDTEDAFELLGVDLGPATTAATTTAQGLGASNAFALEVGSWFLPTATELAGLAEAGALAPHAIFWAPGPTPGVPAAVRDLAGASPQQVAKAIAATPSAQLILGDDLVADAELLASLRSLGDVPRAVLVIGGLVAPHRQAAWLASVARLPAGSVEGVVELPPLASLPSSWRAVVPRLAARAGGSTAAEAGVLIGLDAAGVLHGLGPAPTRAAFAHALGQTSTAPPGEGVVLPTTRFAGPLG
jgi:hypothetical protein